MRDIPYRVRMSHLNGSTYNDQQNAQQYWKKSPVALSLRIGSVVKHDVPNIVHEVAEW